MMRVLMVGAGSCQISGIKRLKAMGHEVYAADYTDQSIGKTVADHGVLADAFSPEAIESACLEFGIQAIMTMGTDQPVLTIGKVAAKLGLPSFLSVETAYAVTHKKAMKLKFRDLGLPTSPFAFVSKQSDIESCVNFDGPYVLKPMDSQGQRGIVIAEDKRDIQRQIDYVLGFSREDEILVEQVYNNEEITVTGWVHEGQVSVVTVTDRVTFPLHERVGVCTAHEYPSKYLEGFEAIIVDLTEKICSGFDIYEGPLYFQFLIGNDGIYVNEIACRLGGAYEDLSLPFATGMDLLKLNILGVTDRVLYIKEFERQYQILKTFERTSVYTTQLFFCRPGSIASMTALETLKALPFILDAGYNYKVGDIIPKTVNASQRAGYAIITAPDEETLRKNLSVFYNQMKILDPKGDTLVLSQKRNRKRLY
ncbi:phosphoribosylaminoimidazole carboxylase (NCAIR synthetase) [Fusibacter tunisiensis]|uniref:Phosphoribosylaminoimidazole carboxylase (NCAIR synthetase) n=2 Tax=Fusibacter tunisiensis TaxID=1008308 RepID=A0ABS2MRS2_9FIRM|nr:phosphoribosylaminoimidazole carboxylase (NCAIR synthetase) [Fusibacter tunisiensis]